LSPKPIGFDLDEPEYAYHGESMHPDRVDYQCMCGHPDYVLCELEREYGMTPRPVSMAGCPCGVATEHGPHEFDLPAGSGGLA
jgi:hypothetical protein